MLGGGETRARALYVAPYGNDANAGTIDSPFGTIPRGIAMAVAGDTIFVRGGIYAPNNTITISKSGTGVDRYHLFAYAGERPVVDDSAEASGSRGIELSGSYWHIRGLDIRRAGDNGIHIRGSNNIVERCTVRENADSGLQLDNGASNNQIINCDSYFNVDPGQGNADGFAPKLTVGSGNYFYGCRSWQNSDDGWDGYLRGVNNVTTTLENCWVFMNGYLKDGSASTGNGNGFKMGGSDLKDLAHNMILKNCLAFDNRVKGFDQNNNRGSMTLYNCTAYRNGKNYSISLSLDSGKTLEVKNCAALDAYGSLGAFAIQGTNSWMSPFVVDNTDFISIDTAGVRGPRQADGSLPQITFMHLAKGSDLIDAGTNVGLPFNGGAPDLGCFESPAAVDVREPTAPASSFQLEQNHPNPFNPATTIQFSIVNTQFTILKVYDLLGREVCTLVNEVKDPGTYTVQFSVQGGSAYGGDGAGLASGVYYYRMTAGRNLETRKMLLIR
jgi:hypothetical protein